MCVINVRRLSFIQKKKKNKTNGPPSSSTEINICAALCVTVYDVQYIFYYLLKVRELPTRFWVFLAYKTSVDDTIDCKMFTGASRRFHGKCTKFIVDRHVPFYWQWFQWSICHRRWTTLRPNEIDQNTSCEYVLILYPLNCALAIKNSRKLITFMFSVNLMTMMD